MTARPVLDEEEGRPVLVPDEVDPPFALVAATDGAWMLVGEIDVASEAAVQRMLAATTSDWVVDVSGLEFADVAGMRAIASAAAAAGTPLTLRGASETFRRYWRLAGFDVAARGVALAD